MTLDVAGAAFVVSSKTMLTEDVALYTIKRSDGQPVPKWAPGAHIDIRIADRWTRQYSLCGDPNDLTCLRIAVQREAEGRGGSLYFVDNVSEGSPVIISALRNNFPVVRADAYSIIAGGIGITPMLPMIRQLSAENAEWRLYYGGRTLATMAFAETLQATYSPNVTLVPQDSDGLLDVGGIIAGLEPHAVVYCCGPEPLITAVEKECTAVGGELRTERFSPRPDPLTPQESTFEVEVASTGERLVVPAGVSILEVLEDAGAVIDVSCEEGVCGTCITRVLDGIPDHRDSVLTAQERDSNSVITVCVSRARTPLLVLDL
jgi:ferredoxin-NADP reductase